MSARSFWQRRFFWQMVFSLLVVALVLFSVMHRVAQDITINMTVLKESDQRVLLDYAKLASDAQEYGDTDAIVELTQQVADELAVWSAVQTAQGHLLSATPIPVSLAEKLGFQRLVEWPVHPFMTQVLIGIPLKQEGYSFVIELPAYMHPKPNTSMVFHGLTLVAPSLVLMLFCWLLYRYLMRPLEALNRGTLKFAEGDLSARVQPELSGRRRDEITQLASSFDSMADRIQRLVNSHRQLLGDLSHELRTPLTRLELALEQCSQEQLKSPDMLPRLHREVDLMRELVGDALTLAWLDSDPDVECADEFNLSTLLDLLCEDAEFEYPEHLIKREYPPQWPIVGSNQRALAHSIENVLRNALKYSPVGSTVTVRGERNTDGCYIIEIVDQGPGVEQCYLEKIFEPFFRTDKARSREEGGFGLGLALVRRQLEAMGGGVSAHLNTPSGLCIRLRLPGSGAV